jgi:two-component system chemotaxis response regulator CheB
VSGSPGSKRPQSGGQRDLVVVGASAGGVDALQELVKGLPPEFPASVLVVLHVASSGTSVLPQILARHGALPASFATDRAPLRRGQIYVAPSDQHMLVYDDHIHLTRGPRENGHRPAIDPTFRSAARAAGTRVIGVILSGLLDDGAAGLQFVKGNGGAAVVQDPADAIFPSMPVAALEAIEPDRVVPIADMAEALCRLIEQPVERWLPAGSPSPIAQEALPDGPPSALTCPECGGALWQAEVGGTLRYVCHTGHAYSLESLVEEQGRSLEMTLWSALRALQERADMQRRLARRAEGGRRVGHERRADEATEQAVALRDMLGRIGRLAVSHDDGP